MFTIRQVTKILNLSKSKIHLLIREGSLESVLIGRSRRITEGQLVRFIHLLEEQS
jgi:excisionase family DNA binding protein